MTRGGKGQKKKRGLRYEQKGIPDIVVISKQSPHRKKNLSYKLTIRKGRLYVHEWKGKAEEERKEGMLRYKRDSTMRQPLEGLPKGVIRPVVGNPQ